MELKIRKGCLVKLNTDVCFTMKQGGKRAFPLTNYANDAAGLVEGSRPITKEETRAWYDSDASKGMTSAGETKLPPRSVYVPLHRDRIYQVIRARCRVSLGYGNPTPGMVKLLCTHSGSEAYVKRGLVTPV